MNTENFRQKISTSYTFNCESVLAGSAILGDDYNTQLKIQLPLKTFNRHGLIAGATGTGKTKSLQVIVEELSNAGVPVLVMDIKGDLSGLGAAGTTNNVIEKRAVQIGLKWEGKSFPIEFLSISDEPGAKLKATISEFGPVLLSKILNLNDNQSGVLSMIFKYCDDRNLPLLDIKDLKSVLKYIQEEGKEDIQKEYGYIQSSTAGSIMRNIIALEQQDANDIFGEPSFEIFDLMQKNSSGDGMVNILRLTDMQAKPSLFSTFMLCLLAEIFEKMPELGDPEKPELVMFIDEAHLIFNNAPKKLLDQFEMTIKLIRSKGVGIFFVTQSPTDIPAEILGQLGTKIQHSLRAFTARDRKDIKTAAENYPYSDYYKVDELITQMGTGEALISTLDEKGRPTELVHTLMRPPFSRMDVLTDFEIGNILISSKLIKKYNVEFDRESAYEILQDKIARLNSQKEEENFIKERRESDYERPVSRNRNEISNFEKIMKSPVTKSIAVEITRGILGVLGLRTTRRTSSSRTRKKY